MTGTADVAIPLVSPLTTTADSRPFGGLPPDLLDELGYDEVEVFLTGTGDLYDYDLDYALIRAEVAVPYTTHAVVHFPSDPARFSGRVIIEPAHRVIPAGIVLARSLDYIASNSDAWITVMAGPLDLQQRLAYDEFRYAPLNVTNEGHIWDVLCQLARLIKSNHPSSPLAHLPVQRVYAAGASMTGQLMLTFLGEGFPERQRMPDRSPLFDGHLVVIAHGVDPYYAIRTPAQGSTALRDPLPHPSDQIPLNDPRRTIRGHDAPVIQMITEGDLARCLTPPDIRDLVHVQHLLGLPPTVAARLRYRRDDGDDPGDLFRLYEIAGPGHSSLGAGPDTMTGRITAYSAGQLPPRYAERFGIAHGGSNQRRQFARVTRPFSDFPTPCYYGAALRTLFRWAEDQVAPAPGAVISVDPDTLAIERDRHGNALGGVRSPQLDVPIAEYTGLPAAGVNTRGVMRPFDADTLRGLYGDHATYLRLFTARTDELIDQGWLLPLHRQHLINLARGHRPLFG